MRYFLKDLAEIPDNVKNNLEIHPVKWIDEVLKFALERMPEATPDEPGVKEPIQENVVSDVSAVTKH